MLFSLSYLYTENLGQVRVRKRVSERERAGKRLGRKRKEREANLDETDDSEICECGRGGSGVAYQIWNSPEKERKNGGEGETVRKYMCERVRIYICVKYNLK